MEAIDKIESALFNIRMGANNIKEILHNQEIGYSIFERYIAISNCHAILEIAENLSDQYNNYIRQTDPSIYMTIPEDYVDGNEYRDNY